MLIHSIVALPYLITPGENLSKKTSHASHLEETSTSFNYVGVLEIEPGFLKERDMLLQ